MIDRATVDKIIDAAQIVDVVSEFVTLRKSGVNYKGLCPFHDDRNPSFMVSPSKNICHCFVCGKGGTPAGFLMEHEQISYPEALRWLAKKYHIEIVEKELTDEERKEQGERESMFIVNEWAAKYFNDILNNDPDGVAIGKQYFRSRGIRDDIIEKFQLGFSLNRRDAMAQAAMKAGYKAEYLVKTGLCYEKNQAQTQTQPPLSSPEGDIEVSPSGDGRGVLVDRYRGRAIFPWFNVSGKVVAFGGRVLDSRTKGVAQKYVNSPESDIYHKERELYGIFQAKRAIVKEDRVFMVEGYTDVIAMHQAGVENVVANSGTALSNHQIRMLHRFTSNITLLYDGDEAGIHAAMRGTDMLLAEGMNIKVLLLPDGDDPDSFARKHSSDELRQYIEAHQTDFITFKIQLTVENATDPVKRSEAIGSIVKSISVIPDPILRSTYISELSRRIGMKEQTLIESLNNNIRQNIEEKNKEREREERRLESTQMNGQQATTQSATEVPQPIVATAPPVQQDDGAQGAFGLHSVVEQSDAVARMLVREIVRYGEQVIYDNVETDDGSHISLTVAQYIDFNLSEDQLFFSNPLYEQIRTEAVAHMDDPNFKTAQYFANHPDINISHLATQLLIDRHQLGGRFKVEQSTDALRQRVVHLIMDFRLDIVEKRMKDIQQAIRQATGDMERIMSLMQEYSETQNIRNALAKQLGSDLMIN